MRQPIRRRDRIARLSRQMRAVTISFIALSPLAFFIALLIGGYTSMLPVPPGVEIDLSGLNGGGHAALIALAAVRPLAFVVVLYLVQDLFRLFGQGVIFGETSIERVYQIGWALVCVDLADFLQRIAIGPLLTGLDAAAPFLTVGIGVATGVIGLFLVVIAKIMDLGRELEEMDRLTV